LWELGGSLYISLQAIPALIVAAIAAIQGLNIAIEATVASLGALKVSGFTVFSLFAG